MPFSRRPGLSDLQTQFTGQFSVPAQYAEQIRPVVGSGLTCTHTPVVQPPLPVSEQSRPIAFAVSPSRLLDGARRLVVVGVRSGVHPLNMPKIQMTEMESFTVVPPRYGLV